MRWEYYTTIAISVLYLRHGIMKEYNSNYVLYSVVVHSKQYFGHQLPDQEVCILGQYGLIQESGLEMGQILWRKYRIKILERMWDKCWKKGLKIDKSLAVNRSERVRWRWAIFPSPLIDVVLLERLHKQRESVVELGRGRFSLLRR